MAASPSFRLACLGLILAVSPAFAGVRVTEPWSANATEHLSFELGTSLSRSSPTGSSKRDFDSSPQAAIAATWMQSGTMGIGLELGYSRWLVPSAGAQMDQILTILGHGTIRGTEVTMSATRMGLHFRGVPLPRFRVTPWVETGVGVNRLNTRIDMPPDQLIAAGWSGKANGKGVTWEPDFTTRLGLDVKTSAQVKVGFEASWQWMFVENGTPDTFSTFSLGGRMRFGRWSS